MRLLVLLAAASRLAVPADPVKPPQRAIPQKTLRVPLAPAENEIRSGDLKATLSDGKPARIVRVRGAKDDLLILVVMDVVGDLSLADSARNALSEQLRTMPATTWVSVLRAQDGLQATLDPTANRDKIAEALRAIPVTGKAGLLDTVQTAAALADSIAAKSAVRIAILYVTDSDVRNYREDFTNPVINSSDSRDLSRRFPEGLVREKIARLSERLTQRQTPVFIVHLNYLNDRLNEAYQSGLMQLASATGGTAAFCRSPGEVPDAVTRALEELQAMQQVWIQLPPRVPATVQIVLEAEGRIIQHRSRFVLK